MQCLPSKLCSAVSALALNWPNYNIFTRLHGKWRVGQAKSRALRTFWLRSREGLNLGRLPRAPKYDTPQTESRPQSGAGGI